MRFAINLAAGLTLVLATGLCGEQLWLAGKAALAERLIERAYIRHLLTGEPEPPWPWADTHPLARLSVPRLGLERTILAGASGSSLAFGPGHVDGTARPNRGGTAAVAGHRDGSFAFLGKLVPGDRIEVESRDRSVVYRVREGTVRRFDDGSVLQALFEEPGAAPGLLLVTCWPIEGQFPGPLRYVVRLEAEEVAERNPLKFVSAWRPSVDRLGSGEHVQKTHENHPAAVRPALRPDRRRLQRQSQAEAAGSNRPADVRLSGRRDRPGL